MFMNEKNDTLRPLIDPKSIAIIGASADPERIGGRPIKTLMDFKYRGRILPVNPKYEKIAGLPCYPHISKVPGDIDVAIILVQGSLVLDTVRECGERGVRSVIVVSGGFAETSVEGMRSQKELVQIAHKHGMRILGPNTVGMFNALTGAFANFGVVSSLGKIPKGRIAIVSQSGAFCGYLYTLAVQNQIGLNYFIGTGNEADVDVADCIAYLSKDPHTDVIACYIEGIKDGKKFLKSLKLAKRYKKPVVVLKVGRTEIGQKAALSHTASLAGSDVVYDAIFKQEGVYRVESMQELLDVAYACSYGPLPQGKRVAIFTISGGAGVMLSDQLSERGLSLPQVDQEIKEKLLKLVPFATVHNPFDFTGQLVNQPKLMSDFMKTVLDNASFDMVVSFIATQGYNKNILDKVLEAIKELREWYPHIPQLLTTVTTLETKQMIHDVGIPVFDDPIRMSRVAKALCEIGEKFPPVKEESDQWEKKKIDFSIYTKSLLTENVSKDIIKVYGIPVTREKMASTPEEAVRVAKDIGYPVVLKGMSSQITHKTDKGLVHLNVQTDEGVTRLFTEIQDNILREEGAECEGVLVQEMLDPGIIEILVGVKNDSVFGPMVMLGLGGVFVEAFNDISMRMAPVNLETAQTMIQELRGADLLKGIRGQQPADLKGIAEIIVALSRLAFDYSQEIEEVDINPVIVYPEGHGVRAVDALVKLKNDWHVGRK